MPQGPPTTCTVARQPVPRSHSPQAHTWSLPDSLSVVSGLECLNAVSRNRGDGDLDASKSDADEDVEPVGDDDRSRSSPTHRDEDRDTACDCTNRSSESSADDMVSAEDDAGGSVRDGSSTRPLASVGGASAGTGDDGGEMRKLSSPSKSSRSCSGDSACRERCSDDDGRVRCALTARRSLYTSRGSTFSEQVQRGHKKALQGHVSTGNSGRARLVASVECDTHGRNTQQQLTE